MAGDPAAKRFKTIVDNWVGGTDYWGFNAYQSALLGQLTGQLSSGIEQQTDLRQGKRHRSSGAHTGDGAAGVRVQPVRRKERCIDPCVQPADLIFRTADRRS